ncbi:sensor histidine kinase [Vulgatibacter incomptus]|uniref:histidine kinase n=1 Tax=Vulgatibacter incomptus TaxID=1391653 RepID=A0A0K1PEW7_9BACT|nr:ATP-binding protein [Vulgatibacter incomptus]AKU92073.1 Phosphate regulon sensor protein PhoR (SphS) [Vulgatibacter incomptus]
MNRSRVERLVAAQIVASVILIGVLLAGASRGPLFALTLAIALLAGVSGVLIGRSSRELKRITDAAQRIANGDAAARPPEAQTEGLSALSWAVGRMAEQLASQVERISSQRELLEGVLTGMEDSILVLRPNGRLLLANHPAQKLFRLPWGRTERPFSDLVRVPGLLEAVQRASRGEPAPIDEVLPGPPRRELVGRAAPLSPGGEAAIVVVVRDVTELRRLEAVRRDFVASASHELRTPVAALRGYAETLASGALDDRDAAERFVAGMFRQAQRLSALIDGLLDLSRIESGSMALEPETVEVCDAIHHLADGARERAESKGLTLVVKDASPTLTAFADPRAIEIVVGNLLENAIKYTPSGGTVTIAARAEDDASIRIDVRDTGPGIDPLHQPRIFERFYRVDAGRDRDVGGTGLGLAISKHLAQQSGGDVGLESRPGGGCRFWVRLPSAAASQASASASAT